MSVPGCSCLFEAAWYSSIFVTSFLLLVPLCWTSLTGPLLSAGKEFYGTRYDGTLLELFTEFKYFGITLTRDGSMLTAAKKIADNFRSAIARIYRIGDSKGNKYKKYVKPWLFQVFALTAGLYGCQVWATSSLTYDSSKITPTHVLHLGFLKKLLGVKKSTDTHCVLRETGQMTIFFNGFRCIIQFWNSLLSSNNLLLEKVVQADLLIANRSDTWTYQVLHTLQDFPACKQFLNAIRESIHLKQFELTLRERIIRSWRELDNLTPHENHYMSRTMRSYHTHSGVPLRTAPGWWDDRKRNHNPMLPIYLCLNISNNLNYALSCLCLSGHNFLAQRLCHNSNRRPYELRICDKCDWHSVQNEEHILLPGLSAWTSCKLSHTAPPAGLSPQYEDSPTRLRTFLNQPDISGVASFVAECLALFPYFFLESFSLVSGIFQASAQMPPRGIYSDVTLPYLFSKDQQVVGKQKPAHHQEYCSDIHGGCVRCLVSSV